MLRTKMIDNLIDCYTMRELRALADRLGIDLNDDDGSHAGMVFLADRIHDILFDPGCSYIEFNKLAEANDGE